MTPDDIALVQQSWRKIEPVKEIAAELFYTKLFELDPSLKRLFQGDMKEQGRKSMAMLSFLVGSLGRMEEIVPVVRSLGVRHAGYGVRDEHYDTVGTALLSTLQQGIGVAFTPEVREAWIDVYGTIARTMKEAARVPA